MKPKKSLGQNFLESLQVINALAGAGEVVEGDIILEIGPGKGALTHKLLARGARVIAVEKDNELYAYLQKRFENEITSGQFVLHSGDILKYDPGDDNLELHKYKIVANIPYNITGAILEKFLTHPLQPTLLALLVQKEVAQRVVANDNKQSILSLSVRAFGIPKIVRMVSRKAFSPAPRVDSAILKIAPTINDTFVTDTKRDRFFEMIHIGFAHKRKLLMNNLSKLHSKEELERLFATCDIPQKTRAENLEVDQWLCITDASR